MEIDLNNLTPEFLHEDLQNSIIELNGKLFINHILCQNYYKDIDPFDETSNNAFINLEYIAKLKIYRKQLKQKNYDAVLDILDKQKQMPWFLKNYKKIYQNYGDKKFYEIFRSIITYVDYHYPYRKKYNEVLNYGENPRWMMSKEEKKHFSMLPNKFRIYRGICFDKKIKEVDEKDKELLIGNSWTLDYNKARWFAKNHAPKFYDGNKYKKMILSYEINKKEVIAYFKDRNEEEIYVDFNNIKLEKIRIQLQLN